MRENEFAERSAFLLNSEVRKKIYLVFEGKQRLFLF